MMLPIVQAMQLLSAAEYQPLGPLLDQHEFPLLVKKDQVVYVAKIARLTDIAILKKLKQHAVIRMPEVVDVLVADDCAVSVERLINGQTLADQLALTGTFTKAMVTQVADELLETLEQLADLEIIHRDIKLSNIVFSENHYYLIDVNAARLYHVNQSNDTRLLGTNGFAAPENYGFAQTDQRSDLYALGIVLNCLLTGQTPHEKGQHTPHPVLGAWAAIIDKATALDPNQRFQSATEMRQALPGWSQVSMVTATSESPHRFKIKQGLWLSYFLLWVLVLLVGFDQAGLVRQWLFYWDCFTIIGTPMLAHLFNRWVKRTYSLLTWHRYRWWLRTAETVGALLLITITD